MINDTVTFLDICVDLVALRSVDTFAPIIVELSSNIDTVGIIMLLYNEEVKSVEWLIPLGTVERFAAMVPGLGVNIVLACAVLLWCIDDVIKTVER